MPKSRVVLEVGTHSAWLSRDLAACEHQVVVANSRRVKLIAKGSRKGDRVDAELLARLGRADIELLSPVRHRGTASQADLAMLRSRQMLVRVRSGLIVHVRGAVKSFGGRLRASSAEAFAASALPALPPALRPALEPVLEQIVALTQQIRSYEQRLRLMKRERYPEAERLEQVHGVGLITALMYVLVLEDARRFRRSREVGPYVGLVPKQRQSGDSNPQLSITKEGDESLRGVLVQSAQYILGPFGKDSDLRRYGERLIERGGKAAKKRAVIAVARKLAVLLHRLWVSNAPYDPLYQEHHLATAS